MLYLHRRHPAYRPYFSWQAMGSAYAEPAAPEDHETILSMVRRHQGEAAVPIARHWLRRQPDAFLVFRDLARDVIGFMAQLAIHDLTPEDLAADPAVPAALRFIERHGPVRPGEIVTHLRFWMHQDAYQDASPAVNLTAINSSIHWTTQPKLAWNFIAIANPDVMEPHFTSVHMWRSPEADFVVGGRRYGIFAHDWRVEPPAAWLIVKADLVAAGDRLSAPSAAPAASPAAPALLVRSERALAEATRQALRDYTRPDRLAANPLARSRLVADAEGQDAADAAAAALRALLREAVGTLAANPKDAKLHRALWHTYFEPAPTQEQAAELLGLPFNTYRYHLTKGIERVTDWLWQRELAGPVR